MGIRTTQFIGLSSKALEYIKSHGQEEVRKVVLEFYEDGNSKIVSDLKIMRNLAVRKETGRCTKGMFDEDIPLAEYFLPNGTILEERVQFSEWSSGPVIATGLYLPEGELVIGWNEQEYEEYLY